jgi:hypothetical protein
MIMVERKREYGQEWVARTERKGVKRVNLKVKRPKAVVAILGR